MTPRPAKRKQAKAAKRPPAPNAAALRPIRKRLPQLPPHKPGAPFTPEIIAALKARAVGGDGPPFDGVAFLRTLR